MLRTHYGYRAELTPQYRSLRFWMRLDLRPRTWSWRWLRDVADVGGGQHCAAQQPLRSEAAPVAGDWSIGRDWHADRDQLLPAVVEGRGLWFWTKLWNTLLMLACVGYAFFLLNWHMLNFRLNY